MQHVSCDAPDLPLADSTLGFLRGHWRLNRLITDYRTRRTGTFTGRASFLPGEVGSPDTAAQQDAARVPADANGLARPARLAAAGEEAASRLAYREHGELAFGSHRGPAWRELILLGTPDGAADVLFADGRAFYRLDLRFGQWQAQHPCGQDSYLVTVTLLSADSFTESWRVRGPGKDYSMTATLTRTGGQA